MGLWIKDGPLGICSRCHRKFLLSDLSADPNIPGMTVCEADRDEFDPYRRPQRKAENIAVRGGTGPDVSLRIPNILWDEGESLWDDGDSIWGS